MIGFAGTSFTDACLVSPEASGSKSSNVIDDANAMSLVSPEASGSKFLLRFKQRYIRISLVSPEASGSKSPLKDDLNHGTLRLVSPEASGSKYYR